MAEKILIVDDDIDTLKLVGMMLEQKGYEIMATSNGVRALKVADAKQPDLILLDVMMPEMDGFEVARRLRANPKTENTPIIMFTAKSQVDDRVEGFEAGADAYLTKPTQPRELFAQVKALLKRAKKQEAIIQAPVAPLPSGKIFGVLAAKGGIGVSTLALNLAVTFYNKTKERVILSDFRPGQGTIALNLGMKDPTGMVELLKSNRNIEMEEVKIKLQNNSGVMTLLSSYEPENTKYTKEVKKFSTITKHLGHLSAYTVLDLGQSFHPFASNIIGQCDRILLCMEPTENNVHQTRLLFDALVRSGVSIGFITAVLINRMRTSVQLSWTQAEELFGHTISVVFTPVPEMAYQAAQAKTPLVLLAPGSLAAQQFDKLATTLL